MKDEIQKQIEARTGEILRKYTTFEEHLKNFIQQFRPYDLLLMCDEIYKHLQKKRLNDKIISSAHSVEDYKISAQKANNGSWFLCNRQAI